MTALKNALLANESSYLKILKVNLTFDSFEIIKTSDSELDRRKGYDEKLSLWMQGVAQHGQVHEEDLDMYHENTNLEKLRSYFREGQTEFKFAYRRLFKNKMVWHSMQLIPSEDYTNESQHLYMYVSRLGDVFHYYDEKIESLQKALRNQEEHEALHLTLLKKGDGNKNAQTGLYDLTPTNLQRFYPEDPQLAAKALREKDGVIFDEVIDRFLEEQYKSTLKYDQKVYDELKSLLFFLAENLDSIKAKLIFKRALYIADLDEKIMEGNQISVCDQILNNL